MAFLRNSWYVACWSDELDGGAPLGRVICDDPVVLFRTDAGGVVALSDRCPHRFAPLSYGKVSGAALECRYHGLRFDASGHCVRNPHGAVNPNAQVRPYPVQEAHLAIWIWMGDSDRADPALIPDFSRLAKAKCSAFNKGYLRTRANYLLLVDNILDLSHIDFLHPATLGGRGTNDAGSITGSQAGIKMQNGALTVRWEKPALQPSPAVSAMMGIASGASIRQTVQVEWRPAGVMSLNTTVQENDAGSAAFAFELRNVHCLTPETAKTTHYFFASTRNFAEDDEALNQQIALSRRTIFETEDEWMCKAVQERMGDADLWDLKPALLSIDAASVRMRRSLEKLLADEAAT